MTRRNSYFAITIMVAGLLVLAVPGTSRATSLTPDQETVVLDSNQLAFGLFHFLRQGDGNVVLSPYSLSQALAMVYAGSDGETERQIQEATGLSLPHNRLHSAFRELRLLLEGRQAGESSLLTATSLWVQNDYKFLAPFLRTATSSYGAGAYPISFTTDPEQARHTINSWLGEHRDGRVGELLPAGLISHLTRIVLVGTSQFRGVWKHGFDPAITTSERFTIGDGRPVEVPMLTSTGQLSYYRGQGFQMVELTYRGDHQSMLIILPDEDELATIERSIQPEWIASAEAAMTPLSLALQLPRFSCSTTFRLQPALAAMGMPVAFTDDANFSGITGHQDLALEDVVHQVALTISEEGAEVVAESGSVVRLKKGPHSLRIDRPFLFLIRDLETGMVLVLGRISVPATDKEDCF
jgi:serpin B